MIDNELFLFLFLLVTSSVLITILMGLLSIKSKKEVKKMAYEEVESPTWKYENDGDFVEGKVLDKKSDIGVNKSWLYSLETPDGVIGVWGSTILDQRMIGIKVDDKIKITYKGLGESKGGKNAPKIFKVEVWEEDKVETQKVN